MIYLNAVYEYGSVSRKFKTEQAFIIYVINKALSDYYFYILNHGYTTKRQYFKKYGFKMYDNLDGDVNITGDYEICKQYMESQNYYIDNSYYEVQRIGA